MYLVLLFNDCIFGSSFITRDFEEWVGMQKSDLNIYHESCMRFYFVPFSFLLITETIHFIVSFLVGGNDGSSTLSSCERYDPHLDKWTMIAPMNTRRAGGGASVINGYLYAIGK